jgi:hypothetical protein
MPRLVRLYIVNVALGFVLALVFVGLLLGFNVGGLWRLVSTSGVGWVAVLMLVVFNALVFSGVQFAIAVMRMAAPGEVGGGRRARRLAIPRLVAAKVPAHKRR